MPAAALHRAIDQVARDVVATYHRAHSSMWRALDRIWASSLDESEVDVFLPRLLGVVVETSEVDAAWLLLLEDGRLVPRAVTPQGAAAFTPEIVRFSEEVARAGDDVLRRQAPGADGAPLQAVYGLPLLHDGALIGVAVVGTRSSWSFSEDEREVFRAMASRAAAVISQATTTEALRESEARFRATFDLAPVGVVHVAFDGRFLRFHHHLPALLG
ncbi:MAG: GAF domain-containing protein, partial [Myxococcales bacterium]